jgi:hypothetical protein
MHAIVAFAERAGVAGVNDQAEDAAIDLRGADIDEFAQFRVKTGLVDLTL